MKVLATALATVVLTGSTPASAHWQFTQWGMTPKQVVDASGGTAHLVGSGEAVEGTYSAGGRAYSLKFSFSGNALARVVISSGDSHVCEQTLSDLVVVYGGPNRKEINRYGDGVAEWYDYLNTNDLVFAGIGRECTLTYSPLTTAEKSGL